MAGVDVALGVAGIGVALPALAEVWLPHSNSTAWLNHRHNSRAVDGRQTWKINC